MSKIKKPIEIIRHPIEMHAFVGPDFNIFPLHVGDICGRYDFNKNFNLIK
jgi:hypothetical protein